MHLPRAALAALAAALLLSGCAQQAVSNRTDHFSYGGQVSGKDESEHYTWHNTHGKASVQWGGQVASGSLSIAVKDAGGHIVYSQSVAGASQGGSDGTTSDGTPGDWDITLNFSGFTGQMGLNIEASGTGIACPPAVPYC